MTAAFRSLDDSLVQFVLLKFPVGSGTFKRNKFIYVHTVGPQCGIVKRGKCNAELGNVLRLFLATHAGLEWTVGKDDLTFEAVVTKLQKVFVSDDGSFSVAKIQEEYNRRLAEEAAKMVIDVPLAELGQGASPPGSPIRRRKLATELGLQLEAVLKAVREDVSPFNWCTFQLAPPKELRLVEAGSNGLFEVVEHLDDDKLLFGIVRMAFGVGRFRRSKHIFFMWAGDAVGAVQKARAGAQQQDIVKLVGPCNAEIRLMGKADLSPEAIIAKVKSAFVVDNINLPAGEVKKAFSTDEYILALQEEQKATSAFYQEPEDMPVAAAAAAPPKPTDFDVAETVRLIRADEGGLTWGIFQVA